ncbi:uncharacterized protein ARMOST_04710 [Armillaria ostoyae]|uniref:Uncharacterized protein n=1 Tax=Armillaria ostoyae TaxID=47428 RepID=A0A284QY38_ARMOS|nr:uncharacterized protein ARMOST_04710 [Armillaria ostoyae]
MRREDNIQEATTRPVPHFRLLNFMPWFNLRPGVVMLARRFCTISAPSSKHRATAAHLGGRLTSHAVKFQDKRQGTSKSVASLAFY